MATLTKLIRTFEQIPTGIASQPYQLSKRMKKLPALEPDLIPCLNCGKMEVQKAHGQIVRFCSKECRKRFKRAEYKETKRNK